MLFPMNVKSLFCQTILILDMNISVIRDWVNRHVKYLRIYIDKVLSWIKLIDINCSKLGRANGVLSKLHRLAPLKACFSAYYSIFIHTSHTVASPCLTQKKSILIW